MTMVERVAKSIYEKAIERALVLNPLGFTAGCQTWEDLEEPDRSYALGEARAAIEAMREPTEGMVDAANEADRGMMPWANQWSAMIDVALSE